MVKPPLAVGGMAQNKPSLREGTISTDVGGTLRGGTITLPDGSSRECFFFFCFDSFVFFFASTLFLRFFLRFFLSFLRKSPTTALVPIGRVYASLLWVIKWDSLMPYPPGIHNTNNDDS